METQLSGRPRLRFQEYRVGVERSGRVADDGGADSILRFQLKRGSDETKRYRKMKRGQRAHLGSMEKKRDMMRRCGDIDQRRGSIRKGKGRRQCQLG
jgi:hypothetical protein